MTRHYVLWDLPFAAGIKHIASITARLTGRDQVAAARQSRMLTELAKLQD